ncbi:MAG: ABC transporter permease [candidate division NC10 bacterium]|nr:ABC transporter permease [candidate division NC10 bacterium]
MNTVVQHRVDRTNAPEILIEPSRGWQALGLKELWEFRELFYFLAWRDIKVRYKQTALGASWAILQPLLSMLIFTLIFGILAKIPSDGLPYPLFAYSALLPWQLFVYALTQSSNSLIENARLISKVYFPRLVVPLASVVAGVVDFFIAFSILILLMFYYGVVPTWGVLALPFFLILALGAAMSVGLWMSALNVKYRDVRYTIPFLAQAWMFATPIVYPSSMIPEAWRWLYGLNPMAGVVEGFRWALLGTNILHLPLILVSTGVVVIGLVGGLYYFKRMEKMFADLV